MIDWYMVVDRTSGMANFIQFSRRGRWFTGVLLENGEVAIAIVNSDIYIYIHREMCAVVNRSRFAPEWVWLGASQFPNLFNPFGLNMLKSCPTLTKKPQWHTTFRPSIIFFSEALGRGKVLSAFPFRTSWDLGTFRCEWITATPKKIENRHVNYQYLIYHYFRRIFLSHFSMGFALLRLFPPHFRGWSWNHLKTMDLAQRNTALAALSVENLKVGPWTLFRAIEIRNLHLGNKKRRQNQAGRWDKRPTSLYAYIYILDVCD